MRGRRHVYVETDCTVQKTYALNRNLVTPTLRGVGIFALPSSNAGVPLSERNK